MTDRDMTTANVNATETETDETEIGIGIKNAIVGNATDMTTRDATARETDIGATIGETSGGMNGIDDSAPGLATGETKITSVSDKLLRRKTANLLHL